MNKSGFEHSKLQLLYYTHCKQLGILPVQYGFDFHDFKLFHIIVHKFSSIKLPTYLHFIMVRVGWDWHTLTTFPWSLILSQPELEAQNQKGFLLIYTFYRTHLSWNRLLHSLCKIIRPSKFKCKLFQFIWGQFVTSTSNTELEDGH